MARSTTRSLLHTAMEHRLMHAETLAYMLHQLPLDQKLSEAQAPSPAVGRGRSRWCEIPSGTATLGLRRETAISAGTTNSTRTGWKSPASASIAIR